MKFLFFMFVFLGSLHLGNLFYGPVIKNHLLQGKMIELTKESRLKADQYLVKDLASFIEENGIEELEVAAIQIIHPTPKTLELRASYEVYREFLFLERTWYFKPSSRNPHSIFPDFTAVEHD